MPSWLFSSRKKKRRDAEKMKMKTTTPTRSSAERASSETTENDDDRETLVSDFVDALRRDGTLEKLETAARRFAVDTSRDVEAFRGSSTGDRRESRRRAMDRERYSMSSSSLETATATTTRTTTTAQLLTYLDAEEDRRSSGVVAPANTAVRLDGTSSTTSSSVALSALSTGSYDARAATNAVHEVWEGDGDGDARAPISGTVGGEMTIEAARVRLSALRVVTTPSDEDSDSPHRTPPRVTERLNDSLRAIRLSASASRDDLTSPIVADEGFGKLFPSTLRSQIHDALCEASPESAREEDSIDAFASWLEMLHLRLSKLPCAPRSASSQWTIGLHLLRSVDHECQTLDAEIARLAFFADAIEREVAEKTRAVQNLIAEVPSQRLQTALSELHRLHLEAVARENHVSQLEAQLARLNSILDDPRLRGPPETPNDAFEYACALCLEGRLSQR